MSAPALTSRQTVRAVSTVVLTALAVMYLPSFGHAAFIRNPVLTINGFALAAFWIIKSWRKYSGEIYVVFLHTAFKALALFRWVATEYIIIDSDTDKDVRKQSNRKLLRCAIMFMLIQRCLIPKRAMSWVFSTLMCKFFLDINNFLYNELRRSQSDQNHNTVPRTRSRFARPAVYLLYLVKAATCLSIFYHQIEHVGYRYVYSTLVYYVLAHNYLKGPLTSVLEGYDLDFFEGMEQHYVGGFLGGLEVLYALVFLTWVLLRGHSLLMLLGLYTNLYASTRDLLIHSVQAAVADWTWLALFEKASVEELRSHDDVCAICLGRMYRARKTPCRHIFHGHCLRRCLNERPYCPICSTQLL